jgi:hypothetical protein
VNVSYDDFVAANDIGRISIFAAGVRTAFEQINDRLLPASDKAILIEKVAAVRSELLSRRGAQSSNADESNSFVLGDETLEIDENTQIVLQWAQDMLSSADVSAIEDVLEPASESLFEVDGHDAGSGTINIFVVSENVDQSVRRIIALAEGGLLRPGVRIGVEAEGAYSRAYPSSLKRFDILGYCEGLGGFGRARRG